MIEQNRSLTHLNSLKLEARAAYFADITTDQDLAEALAFARSKDLPVLPLGGGSNLVLGEYYPGLVLRIGLKGVQLEEFDDQALVWARAGECWHEFVAQMISCGWHGLENLTLIPGDVGAAPIQNIGAYGVEVADRLHAVRAVEIATGTVREFTREACGFGYRESIFKQALKDRFIITDVAFLLERAFNPVLEYGPLQRLCSYEDLCAHTLAQEIEALRRSKLPDPEVLGNAGCFFKNPVVEQADFVALKARYPDLVAFPAEEGVKLAAGWLIDRAGLKGLRQGAVGVYAEQALVLVNYGGARAGELLALADHVREAVQARYGVALEIEPRIY